MKLLFKLVLLLVFTTTTVNAQRNLSQAEQKAIDILMSVVTTYEGNIESKKREKTKKFEDKEKNGLLSQYEIEERDSLRSLNQYNTQMLNLFFAEEVATFFGGSSDLSLQKYFASLNTKDETIDFGANFETRESELDKLNTILTLGFKLKTSDNFGVIIKDGDFQNDNVGLTLKYAKIGGGTINYSSKVNKDGEVILNRAALTQAYRENVLYPKYEALIKDYIKVFKVDLERMKNVNETKHRNGYDYDKAIETIAKSKKNEFYKDLVKEEIKYIKGKQLYRYIRNYWFTIDAFVPLGRKSYLVSDATTNPATETERFWNLEVSGAATIFMKFSSKTSFFANLKNVIN